jgi:selenide,water dikinase
MTHLNADAAAAMVAAGVRAATDVTGYGLVGHLANLPAGAEISYGKVPFLPGVAELAMKDLFPSGSRRNYQAYEDLVDWDGLALVDQLLLCDAQTSGGLLLCLPPERAAAFEQALASSPYHPARIGEVTGDGSIRIRP